MRYITLSFFSGHKKQAFFITKNFDIKLTDKCDLILSPEFYWARKVTLNVNFSYEVQKMAISIFDGLLPNGSFEFKVFKLEKNEYIIIAYDIESIKLQLKNMGIDMSKVDKIYTLQSEFLKNNISLSVDDDFGVATVDGLMVYLPLKFIEINDTLENILSSKKLSTHYIYSHKLQKVGIKSTELNLVILIFLLLNAIAILNVVKLENNRNFLEKQKANFTKENTLPSTSFQVRSMQDELQIINKAQKDLREAILYIQKFQLKSTESFEMIKYEKNSLSCSAKLENKQRENELKNYMSKKPKSSISIEVKL